MLRNGAVSAFFIVLMVLAVTIGCSTVERSYHQYIMRGQILDVTGNEVYLCIGTRDGAVVGQELEVIRNVPVRASGPKGSLHALYRREKVGTVKILSIVDEHYARAAVITGIAEKNNMVELNRTNK